jgi:predicted amidophosphoribosyltransferase
MATSPKPGKSATKAAMPRIYKQEENMFCPKCWAEYPKDFIECRVCNEPLVEERPDASERKSRPASQGPFPSKSSKKAKK